MTVGRRDLEVDIDRARPTRPIVVKVDGKETVSLTWEEARILSSMLNEVQK